MPLSMPVLRSGDLGSGEGFFVARMGGTLPLGLSRIARARHLGVSDEPFDHSAAGLAASRRDLGKTADGLGGEAQVDQGALAELP